MKEEVVRVAYIIGKMWAGGVESIVFNYYRKIDKNRFQFDFFYDADSTVDPSQELISMGARFYKLPPYQKMWEYLPQLEKKLKENKYQIIHSHLNTLSVFTLFAAWRVRIPVRIAHNHSVPGGKEFKRNFLKNFLKHFSRIFATNYCACSEKAGRWMFGDKAFEAGKVFVLRNAIDFERFYPNESRRIKMRCKLGIDSCFVIGHVGRFTYAKNHEFLIELFSHIATKHNDAILLLVGDGERYEIIIDAIKKYGLMDRVILVGKNDRPEDYYLAMDVVVIPSYYEGLSMATVEAQACGVPVVSSNAISQEAVIGDGYISLQLTDPIPKWVCAVQNLRGVEMKYNSYKREYDINLAVKKLESWYDELLGRKSDLYMERK